MTSSSVRVDTAIEIISACVNNLKNVSVRIPRNRLTIITGVSGSGKSSLAFDTLYAEGQRRFVESLSAYARQFLERKGRPNVERITGLPPAIALEQKPLARNPRSTVATVTEVYDYLRLLFGHIGKTYCHQCGRRVQKDSPQQVVEDILCQPSGERIAVAFVPYRDGFDLEQLRLHGFIRVIDTRSGDVIALENAHGVPVEHLAIVVDRLIVRIDDPEFRTRATDAVETAFRHGERIMLWRLADGQRWLYSPRYECSYCGIQFEEPEPRLFSFNSPYGACPTCEGFGRTIGIDEDLVIPDRNRSLAMGAIHLFRNYPIQAEMLAAARKNGIPIDVPVSKLSPEHYRWLWEGDQDFPGINGYFKYLEDHSYKVQNRITLARYRGYTRCPSCEGSRLRRSARQVFVGGVNIPTLLRMSIEHAGAFFERLELEESELKVVEHVLREIRWRLRMLNDIGVGYLTLDRMAHTLSGGEAQRMSIATSLGSTLVGTLYVLDEPSIGLHWRDTHRLIAMLQTLRSLGNTVVVVEHDLDIIRAADYIVDMGPGAGEEGGRVVATGTVSDIAANAASLTGAYLSGRRRIELTRHQRRQSKQAITIVGARENNLRIGSVDIPLGCMVAVTGVSGSGKSTLIERVLYANAKRHFGGSSLPAGQCAEIVGLDQLTDIELVDQSPVGRSSRSTPATYTKAFDAIREVYADTPAARERGWTSSHFSFNMPGGRCEVCEGAGSVLVEMQFLPDIEVPCEACGGTRYRREARSILYNGKSIIDVLNMTVDEAVAFFKGKRKVVQRLKTLQDVGLGYLRLGQSSVTLSGGEAQRLKLAAYLDSATNGHVLYLFDEPTTGLHLHDVATLLACFERLIERGQSVVVIEHNVHVIAAADWVIDLGPEGGDAGGRVVCTGTPEDIAACEESWTGQALQEFFALQQYTSKRGRRKR